MHVRPDSCYTCSDWQSHVHVCLFVGLWGGCTRHFSSWKMWICCSSPETEVVERAAQFMRRGSSISDNSESEKKLFSDCPTISINKQTHIWGLQGHSQESLEHTDTSATRNHILIIILKYTKTWRFYLKTSQWSGQEEACALPIPSWTRKTVFQPPV